MSNSRLNSSGCSVENSQTLFSPTMIEIPRAALLSDQIAALTDPDDNDENKPLCDFFSYGTNDLTQMTMGISRDDANEFVPHYLKLGIYSQDPFKTLDVEGVGALVAKSVADGRRANSNLSLGICGEHGGDPASVAFFDKVGLDCVSCSPFRVPVARLAAGQVVARELVRGRPVPDDIVGRGSGVGFGKRMMGVVGGERKMKVVAKLA